MGGQPSRVAVRRGHAVASGVARAPFVREYLAAGGPLAGVDLAALDHLMLCVVVQLSISSIVADPLTERGISRVRTNLELFEALLPHAS